MCYVFRALKLKIKGLTKQKCINLKQFPKTSEKNKLLFTMHMRRIIIIIIKTDNIDG